MNFIFIFVLSNKSPPEISRTGDEVNFSYRIFIIETLPKDAETINDVHKQASSSRTGIRRAMETQCPSVHQEE